MKFYFFKRNFTRQILLYGLLILLSICTWQMFKDASAIGVVIFGVITLLLLLWIIYQYFIYVLIDERGVTYRALLKEYCLRWEEVGQVEVIPRWNIQIPWLIILRSGDTKELTLKRNAINRRDECITFVYIVEAAEQISRYQKKLAQEPSATFEPEATEAQTAPESIRITVIKKRYITYLWVMAVLNILITVWCGYNIIIDYIASTEKTIILGLDALFFALAVTLMYQLSFGRYSCTVRMGPEGVELRKCNKTYTMAWDDIDKIIAMPNQYLFYNKSAMICFLRKGVEPSALTIDIKKFNLNMFGVQYRERVVAVIRRYWDKQIWNIEKVCDKSKVFDRQR